MPRLLNDIIGPYKKTLYGTAGTEVKVISDAGNVQIVEDGKGFRFPVPTDRLTWDATEIKPIEKIVEKPTPGRSRKKKAVPIIQQNLF